MEIKVGDYVRIYDGVIGKIIDDNFAQEEKRYELDYNNKLYYFQQIVKSSPNIIDLIKVGDYVNGYKIVKKNKYTLYLEDGLDEESNLYIGQDNIKSIVTKEQFAQMEYKIHD